MAFLKFQYKPWNELERAAAVPSLLRKKSRK